MQISTASGAPLIGVELSNSYKRIREIAAHCALVLNLVGLSGILAPSEERDEKV